MEKIDLLNPATAHTAAEQTMIYQNGDQLLKAARTPSKVSDSQIDMLLINYTKYVMDGTIKEKLVGFNDDEIELIKYISLICDDILNLPESEFKRYRIKLALRGLKDELAFSEKFYQSNKHLLEIARKLYEELNPKPGRPVGTKRVVFVNIETGVEEFSFANRTECIDTTFIPKNRLSLYIKSSKENPKCTSKWKKYTHLGKKYWIIEK